MADEADEFAVIARWFAPLAGAGARGLKDDAARIETSGPLVLTCDAIVEGVHFLPEDPIDQIAQKALRVNLSDLAAKGAAPLGYLMTLAWPNTRPARDIGRLAQGLAADQAAYGVTLWGGDTVSTPGPLTIAVTMIGRPLGRTPDRAGARPGHDLWVTGTIGDGALGLAILKGRLQASAEDAAYLADRYRRPQPRSAFAPAVADHASAAMDVSDGLLADAAKIAAASGVRMEIELAAVPLSPAAARATAEGKAEAAALCAGGDDYELLFTAPPEAAESLRSAAAAQGVPLTRIGRCQAGEGAALLGPDRRPLPALASGYAHHLGS